MSVAVIIPFYNRAALISATLDSLLAQSYRDFQLICVDDGSTDQTPTILAAYAARDPRIQVYTCPHTNVGNARNYGLAQSDAAYLFFLDADDLYRPDFLATMLTTLEQTGSDLVACKYDEFDHATGQITRTRNFKTVTFASTQPVTPQHNQQPLLGTTKQTAAVRICDRAQLRDQIYQCAFDVTWNKVFRRALLDAHQLRFQSIAASDDTAFVFQYLAYCQQVTFIDQALLAHRTQDPQSLTNTMPSQFLRCQAMDYLRAQLPPAIFQETARSYYQKYLAISLSACKKAPYAVAQQIFTHTRRLFRARVRGIPPLKQRPRWWDVVTAGSITEAMFLCCLRAGNFALFWQFLQTRTANA